MNGKLYLEDKKDPIATLDHVEIVGMNDNHTLAPQRVFFRTKRLSPGKKMAELFRDQMMRLELDDGRSGQTIIQHTSVGASGEYVGVLRILDQLTVSE